MTVPGISNPALPYDSVVVVTGCSGFVGSHVADQVLAAGFKVRGTTRDADKNSWLKDYFETKHGKGRFELVSLPNPEDQDAYKSVVEGTFRQPSMQD